MNGSYITAGLLSAIFLFKREGSMGKKWTEEEIGLLGKMSDAQVAKKLGLSRRTVGRKRNKLGIKAKDKAIPIDWTEEDIALLGTMSDYELAKKLGVSRNSVSGKRRKLKIPNYFSPREWAEEEISLLGTMSDYELGPKLGVSPSLVGLKRAEMGIPSWRKRWTEEEISLLGKISDAKLAKKLGKSVTAVFNKRKSLGLPSYRKNLKMKKQEERIKKQNKLHKQRTIDLSLNPNLLQGEEFRTKEDVILKGKDSIPSDAGSLPRYVGGKRRLSPGRRDRGGKK